MEVDKFIEILEKTKDLSKDFYCFMDKSLTYDGCIGCADINKCNKRMAVCKMGDFVILAYEDEEMMDVINIPFKLQIGGLKVDYEEGTDFEDVPNGINTWYIEEGEALLMSGTLNALVERGGEHKDFIESLRELEKYDIPDEEIDNWIDMLEEEIKKNKRK